VSIPLNLTGHKFGRLTALKFEISKRQNNGKMIRYWKCLCDCGRTVLVQLGKLRTGDTRSCGCLQDEARRNNTATHRLTRAPEHYIWTSMIQRCTNPNNISYPRYGGRGISVHPRWRKFERFLRDMGRRPSPIHTLERINNYQGYFKGNCRWATRQEQANNKRNNIRITFMGKTKTLAQWAELLGFNYEMAQQRIGKLGWSPVLAISVPKWGKR